MSRKKEERKSQPLVKDCQFGISPVNYSDSDQIQTLNKSSMSMSMICLLNGASCLLNVGRLVLGRVFFFFFGGGGGRVVFRRVVFGVCCP